jgi:OOP family OmpA-OmpF porin
VQTRRTLFLIGLFLTAALRTSARALQMLSPAQTVELEHADRKKRLLRLSDALGINAPQFFEYEISPAEHGLKEFPGSIPLLRVIFQEKVFFDFDKDVVRPETAPILKTVAQSLALDPPDVSLFIAGHTDARGSESYNQALGLRRARAVASQLAASGVNQAQLYDVSFGEMVPIASNETDDGRARNRRVEFLFGARPQPIAAWLVKQNTRPCGDTLTDLQNCTVPAHYTVESVTLSASPRNVATAQAPKQVVFGARIVDLDLHERVFTFRAPE